MNTLKKIISYFSLLAILSNSLIPSLSANFVANPVTRNSNNSTFTIKSNFDSNINNFINTSNLNIDYEFNSGATVNPSVTVNYNTPSASGSANAAIAPYQAQIVMSGSGTSYFSGMIDQGGSFSSIGSGSLLLTNLQDGGYGVNFTESLASDMAEIHFIKDSTNPVLTSTGNAQVSNGGFGIQNVVFSDINFDKAEIKYSSDTSFSQSQIMNTPFDNQTKTGTGDVNLTGLTGNTTYNYKIVISDKAGNITESNVMNFTTLDNGGMMMPVYSNPVTLSFSNSGQISGTGTIGVSLKNDRARTLSGISQISLAIDNSYIGFDSANFVDFSGSLNGNSCSGSLTKTIDYNKTVLHCLLSSPITFNADQVLSLNVQGLQNPSKLGKYPFEVRLKTTDYIEYFFGESLIKDNFDVTPPSVANIYANGAYSVVVEFNEPLFVQNTSAAGGGNNIVSNITPSLGVYSSYVDYNNPRKLFVSTETQTGATNYTLNLSGVKDFNNNAYSGSVNFIGYDINAKRLEYISPYSVYQNSTNNLIDIYGANNIFSTFNSSTDSIGFGSGITLIANSIIKIDDNHLSLKVDVANTVGIGGRDIKVKIGSQNYFLANGLSIDKNWNQIAKFINSNPSGYDNGAKTGNLQIDFDTNLLSSGDVYIEHSYGSSPLTPSVNSATFSGKTLNLTLNGVETNNSYAVSFSGMTFDGKTTDSANKIWFSYFDGNYNNTILAPIVTRAEPSDWSYDIPTKAVDSTGAVLNVYFDQTLQDSSITSDNIKMSDDLGNPVSVSLTYSGALNKLILTTDSELSQGKSYIITLSSNIKSDKGLGLTGNVPASEGGGHKIRFTTKANYATTTGGGGGTVGANSTQGFWINRNFPYYGQIDFPSDSKLALSFNDLIDTSSVTSSGIVLRKVNTDGTLGATTSLTFSYNSDLTPKVIFITPSSLLQNTKYKLIVKNNIKSSAGQCLDGTYSCSNSADYTTIEFTTSSNSYTSDSFKVDWDYMSPDGSQIELGFKNVIKDSSFDNSQFSLYASGGTKITSDSKFNVSSNSVIIKPTVGLLSNTNYTLVVKPLLQDLNGQTISTGSLSNGFSLVNGNIQKDYTPTISISDKPFEVYNSYITKSKVDLNFSRGVSSANIKSNYSIQYCQFNSDARTDCSSSESFTSYSLADALVKYDDVNKKVTIEGLDIPLTTTGSGGTIAKIIISDNLADTYGNALTGNKEFYSIIAKTSIDNTYQGTQQAITLKAVVNPLNTGVNKLTNYFIGFPISKKLITGDKVELRFPEQFDLSSASYSLTSINNSVNGDSTKSKFSSIAIDYLTNKITFTIGSNYTLKDTDYISAEILNIKNPSQSKDINSEGYIANITTNSNSIKLDSYQSNPIYIIAQNGVQKTITFQLKDKDGVNLNVSGIPVHISGIEEGYSELLTDTNGQGVYTGSLNKNYSIYMDAYVKEKIGNSYVNTNYVSDLNYLNIELNDNKTINILLRDKTTDATFLTLTGSIQGLNGKDVSLWVSSNKGYFEQPLGTLNSNNYSYSVKLPKNIGMISFGILPTVNKLTNSFAAGTAAGNYQQPDWQSPRSRSLEVGTSDIGAQDFIIQQPTKNLTITVQDQSGKKIPNAHLYIYSPSGDSVGLYGDSDSLGLKTFKLNKGTYTYGAWLEGIYTPTESLITIGDDVNYTATLTINLPTKTIEGKVLNGTTPLSNVSIYAYNASKNLYVNAMTSSDGSYKLYVEDGSWKLGGWIPAFGSITEETLLVDGSSITNKNITIAVSDLYSVKGTIAQGGNLIKGANIYAESQDGDWSKAGYAFSDSDGNYTINLKNGTYNLKAFHPEYGEIGKIEGVVVSGSNLIGKDFSISNPHSVAVSFTGSGVPTSDNLTKFEWVVDYVDSTNNKGFSQKFKGVSSYTFNKVPAGTYNVKVYVVGLGQVYSSGSYIVDGNKTIEVPLNSSTALTSISGTITDSGSSLPIQDAYIEVRNLNKKNMLGTKTSSGGTFDIKLAKDTNFELLVKKPGYENSQVYTGSTSSPINLGNIKLNPFGSYITVSGILQNSSGATLNNKKIFFNIQGLTGSGTDSSKWYGKEIITTDSGSFQLTDVPANFGTGKIIVSVEGFSMYRGTAQNFASSSITLGTLNLTPIDFIQPRSTSITPSQGGIIDDRTVSLKLTLPSSSLGNDSQPGTVTTKETTQVPNTPGNEPIGGKAKEIKAVDSNGNQITNLSSDATLELTYSGSDLVGTSTGITLEEVRSLQVAYYDPTTLSWISLPTIINSSSGAILSEDSYSGSTLLSSISGYENIQFTLKATTNHFTLFTSLVSTVVGNSSSSSNGGGNNGGGGGGSGGGGSSGGSSSGGSSYSLVTGVANTSNNISKFFGNVEQTIVLKSGSNINSVLTLKRDGKVISLSDILTKAGSTVSSVQQNLVAFSVGDVLTASKDGSIQIAINGYTKFELNPGSSVKVAEAGSNFLTFESVSGKSKYEFSKRDNGAFEYKIKGKTSFATIRGTTLEVSNEGDKDIYNLIEGKIDVYNSTLKKTITMVSGDKYIAYSNGAEDISGVKALQVKTPPVVNKTITTTNTTTTTDSSLNFIDVSESNEFSKYVRGLNGKGIVSNNTFFNPNKSISRIELLKIVIKSKGITPTFDSKFTYEDVNSNHWGAPYISYAKKMGWISSSNKRFELDRSITRAEAIKIISNVKGVKSGFDSNYSYQDVNSTDWFAPMVSYAKKMGWISKTNSKFNPSNNITRAEASKMVYNIFFAN